MVSSTDIVLIVVGAKGLPIKGENGTHNNAYVKIKSKQLGSDRYFTNPVQCCADVVWNENVTYALPAKPKKAEIILTVWHKSKPDIFIGMVTIPLQQFDLWSVESENLNRELEYDLQGRHGDKGKKIDRGKLEVILTLRHDAEDSSKKKNILQRIFRSGSKKKLDASLNTVAVPENEEAGDSKTTITSSKKVAEIEIDDRSLSSSNKSVAVNDASVAEHGDKVERTNQEQTLIASSAGMLEPKTDGPPSSNESGSLNPFDSIAGHEDERRIEKPTPVTKTKAKPSNNAAKKVNKADKVKRLQDAINDIARKDEELRKKDEQIKRKDEEIERKNAYIESLLETILENDPSLLEKDSRNEQRDLLMQAFRTYAEKDLITIDRFRLVLQSLNIEYSDADFRAVIADMNLGDDAKIDKDMFLDFMASMIVVAVDADAELDQVFAVFDTNNSGYISKEELCNVMRGLIEDWKDEQADQMIYYVDKCNREAINDKLRHFIAPKSLNEVDSKRKFERVSKYFDGLHSGFMSKDEFKGKLTREIGLPDNAVTELIDIADEYKVNKVCKRDFIALIHSFKSSSPH